MAKKKQKTEAVGGDIVVEHETPVKEKPAAKKVDTPKGSYFAFAQPNWQILIKLDNGGVLNWTNATSPCVFIEEGDVCSALETACTKKGGRIDRPSPWIKKLKGDMSPELTEQATRLDGGRVNPENFQYSFGKSK